MALTASNIAAWTKAISRSAGGPGTADATMATAVASQSAMTLAEADVIGQMSAKPSSSFGRVVDIVSSRSIEAARLSARLVGQRDGLEIGNLRLRAVTGADSGEPFSRIEPLGRLLAFPHIDAARDLAAAGADELLAQKARNFEEIRRDLREVGAALLQADGRRQVIEDEGGDHGCLLGSRTVPAAVAAAASCDVVFGTVS